MSYSSVASGYATQLAIKKLKATKARIVVLTYIATRKKPFSVNEILVDLKKDAPDQATLYRMLQTFKIAGFVREVIFNDGTVRYEGTTHEHHHHAVCTECGKIEDIHDDAVEKILMKTVSRLKLFRTINDHSLEFFGLCIICAKK